MNPVLSQQELADQLLVGYISTMVLSEDVSHPPVVRRCYQFDPL
jgi:hypothetical protein